MVLIQIIHYKRINIRIPLLRYASFSVFTQICIQNMIIRICRLRETLIKAFPAPDLRREAAHSFANPCASAGGSKEVLI